MSDLIEKIQKLFSKDEDIQEWILLGKLPQEIAEIVAIAVQPKDDDATTSLKLPGSAPEEINYVSFVIQKEFWPNAPHLQRGGFMNALSGGPMPDWLICSQVAGQIVAEMEKRGYEVEVNEPLDLE